MKRALVGVAVVTMAACTGVLVEPGNAFPCDFSKPIGVRDAVCSKGDVCGVDNRCTRYHYEGPQFEGPPTFPTFDDAGTQLHPMQLKGPIDFVARIMGPSEGVVARSPEGTFQIEPLSVKPIALSTQFPALRDVALLGRPTERPLVVGRETNDEVFYEGSGPMNRVRDTGMVLVASRLRALGANQQLLGAISRGRAGVITPTPGVQAFDAVLNQDEPLDLALAPSTPGRSRPPLLILTRRGFHLERSDGGTELVLSQDVPVGSRLVADREGLAYAVLSRTTTGRPNLSTFVASRTGAELRLSPAWSDCQPCASTSESLAETVGVDLTGPFVDVLCPEVGFRRIRGATSGGSSVLCTEDESALPFSYAALEQRPTGLVKDSALSVGFLAGGGAGQIWAGPAIGAAVPLFLDRVPLDVSAIEGAGVSGLAALTDVGLYVRANDPRDALARNGFAALAPDITSKLLAVVHEGRGWAIGRQGQVARPQLEPGGDLGLVFGAQLVDGRGSPISRALAGEAYVADGGVVSMVIAADDSLYFLPNPTPVSAIGMARKLPPVLTPEPSTLIRSFALERTPVGSDGVSRMRGYLVTSRNVYEFKLGGAPLQWTARQLPLSWADPAEVWFDNPRGGLGRVGYRDGTIFSLPGGFPLTESLPANDAGVPSTVVDYENLGGWPVALTNVGLFVARYDVTPAGGLANRFPDGGLNRPMTWREVTLPDGSRPWRPRDPTKPEARPGKLFVVADPQTGSASAYRQLFHLLVFLPNAVIEVGQHERTNATPAKR